MIEHRAFFGDGEKTFALTFPMIKELEAKTGAGIGVLFRRIQSLAFSAADLSEIIRLGLIGGGMAPEPAMQLVKTYVDDRPLSESLPVAMGILSARWFGSTPAEDEATAINDILEQVPA